MSSKTWLYSGDPAFKSRPGEPLNALIPGILPFFYVNSKVVSCIRPPSLTSLPSVIHYLLDVRNRSDGKRRKVNYERANRKQIL